MTSLSTIAQRVRNTPGLLSDTVALVVCTVLGVICSIYVLGQQSWQAPWEDRLTFSAEFDKAPAIRPESLQEVRIAGVQVGRIKAAEPTEDGLAKLTFSLEPDVELYENARVVIRTKSPLNVMYATLDPGDSSAGRLAEGATLPVSQTDRAVQPNEILDNLDTQARSGLTSLLNELDVTMARGGNDLGKGLGNTRDAMASFQPVLEQLERRRTNIRRLVTSFSGIASAVGEDDRRLAELTDATHQALGALASRDKRLSQALAELPGFTDDLTDSMTSVDTLTAELDPTLTELTKASEELPGALNELTGTVGAIRGFVNGAAPVVDTAVPIVKDLRPVVKDVHTSLDRLEPVVATLPAATKRIVPWLDDLAAFVYQTSSSFSLYDANGGLGRADVEVDLTNPTAGLQDEGIETEGGN